MRTGSGGRTGERMGGKMMKGSGGGDERKGWRDSKSLRINEVSRE